MGFFWDLVISLFRGVRFAGVPPFSGLAPSMYLWPVNFSRIECQPMTTPLWSLFLIPVDFLAGKVVGCFVHGGLQQWGGFVISSLIVV